MKKDKRKVEVLVLSDIHLGSYGCCARELNTYLKTIKPEKVILNGDIVDIWQFKKRYWPKSHMKVIKTLINWASKGVPVYYITGNHDEMLRRFNGLEMGYLKIVNQLELQLDNEKAWFFHGDIFDVTMQHSKWLAKLGAVGYDSLILLNMLVNRCTNLFGFKKLSFSKRIKNSVKGAVKHINNFENTVAEMAVDKQVNQVICGHIHHPEIKDIKTYNGTNIKYLNSGDWIENLTALEYDQGEWTLFKYHDQIVPETEAFDNEQLVEKTLQDLFADMTQEFQLNIN